MPHVNPVYDAEGHLHLVPKPRPSVLTSMAWGLFVGIPLGFAHQAVRRWMWVELVLLFGIVYTVQSPTSDYYLDHADGTQGALLGYRFPWYCTAMIIAFCFWGVVGYTRAWRISSAAKRARREALRGPVAPVYDGRVIIDVQEARRPPQGPTGRSARRTPPPPAPTPGSGSPKLFIPTYVGSRRPQRLELTTGGTLIRDDRRIDPDAL